MNSRAKIILTLFFFTIIKNYGQDVQQTTNNGSTKTENVLLLDKEFIIEDLNNISHKIWLYLPPDYDSSIKNYPVIYMHDGQNLFDAKTSFVGEWNVDETLNKLYKTSTKGFIVVGIENSGEERINEYTPWKNKKYGGGKGAIYIDFITTTIKPYIDKNYRTKPEPQFTGLIGSSLGGLISYYGGLKYPTIFGKIGVISPSFWFSKKVIDFTKKHGNINSIKMYLLLGGKEGMTQEFEDIYKLLLEIGFTEKNLKKKLNPQGEHNETFWRNEFLEVITFLFDIK